MPSVHGVVHDAGVPFTPSISTRQSRHDPNAVRESVAHSFGTDLVVVESAAVVLHAELIAVDSRARELHGHRTGFRLALGRAIGGRFDPVANRVVDELAQNFFDGATISARHVFEPDDDQ